MRQLSTLIIWVLSCTAAAGQVSYEPGYYTDLDGMTHRGFVLNELWTTVPTEFRFAFGRRGQLGRTITVREARAFGVDGADRYERAVVPVDAALLLGEPLGRQRQPNYEALEVYLRVLVKGPATLYEYELNRVKHFYFKVGASPIVPLVRHRYRNARGETTVNERYRQQLTTALNCDQIGWRNDPYVKYEESDLSALFVAYHRCRGLSYENYFYQTRLSRFRVFGGLAIERASGQYVSRGPSGRLVLAGAPLLVQIEPIQSVSANLTLEYVLPFDANQWSIVATPLYRRFEAQQTSDVLAADIVVSELNIPVGIRYYAQTSLRSRFFINGLASANVDLGSGIAISGNDPVPLAGAPLHMVAGIGFEHAGRYAVELTYADPQPLIALVGRQRTSREIYTLRVGYRLF